MIKNVPFLAKEYIERDAAALLAEYAREKRIIFNAPIPIEDIIEKHLKLRIEFDDTHRLFNIARSGLEPDILGALFINESRIVIDESLDPEVYPAMENRYRFTLGHEGGGHWRLHRRLVSTDPGLLNVISGQIPPAVIYRSKRAKERAEWQADYYSSCLLMPRDLVFAAWDERFPDGRSRVIEPGTPIYHPFVELPLFEWSDDYGPIWSETVDEAFDRIARPLAQTFLVSPIAMRIRLENLGLLLRAVPYSRLHTVGV